MKSWTRDFLQLARSVEALRFGSFELKSGRISPYFFNAGRFCQGRSISIVADCYADAIVDSGVEFDLLFGPAYKGIPLATAVSVSLFRKYGIDCPVSYNRKESKAHGEGGELVGAALAGRVLVVDDVISAGTAFSQVQRIIEQCPARVVALAVGLDRQERGGGATSAGAELKAAGIEVIAVAGLDDLVADLRACNSSSPMLSDMLEYRTRYGA
ncbi:MAG: orotate phosphoribosyltransferase [Wenzhouxiangellaceae bacterium]|nr:orotate phosphoribosyltransferase [Wenzhouxiangellaceae bacterium]